MHCEKQPFARVVAFDNFYRAFRAASHDQGRVINDFVRSSMSRWFGLAEHADAFRLSRSIFAVRDVRNLGKRLLVRGQGASSG